MENRQVLRKFWISIPFHSSIKTAKKSIILTSWKHVEEQIEPRRRYAKTLFSMPSATNCRELQEVECGLFWFKVSVGLNLLQMGWLILTDKYNFC